MSKTKEESYTVQNLMAIRDITNCDSFWPRSSWKIKKTTNCTEKLVQHQ